ncbi:TIGR01906 family membrane protein [Caldanaerobacter sp.]|uniref:TIGR01906 family membrane protein n=1 Tax=Caldanaerobacter sp. TaxID=2930036 RepID=UPI003C74BC65
MVKRVLVWIEAFIMTFSLILWLFLFNLEKVAFDLNFYKMEYQKNQVSSVTKIGVDELMNITERMHQYLKGQKEDMDIFANIEGDAKKVFNEKELNHMKDVKQLFVLEEWVKKISITIFFVLFGILVWKTSFSKTLSLLLKSIVFMLGALLIFGLFIALDFEKWFTLFHLAFFDNDLWILDVEKDRLIQMFPQEFFQDAVYIIFRNTFIGILLIIVGTFSISKFLKEPS